MKKIEFDKPGQPVIRGEEGRIGGLETNPKYVLFMYMGNHFVVTEAPKRDLFTWTVYEVKNKTLLNHQIPANAKEIAKFIGKDWLSVKRDIYKAIKQK